MNSREARRQRNIARNIKRGFTLTEAIVSMAAASTLMVGLGSTVYLASRATRDDDRASTKVINGSVAVDNLASELHYAVGFIERGTRAVEFTIPDRTGDGVAENIRYAWSGTPGAPLTRSFNGEAPKTVRDDVREFNLSYMIQTIDEMQESGAVVPATPTETLAAKFDGWSGITPTTMFRSLSAGTWMSEYFELPWPAGATSFRVTKLRLKVGQSSASGQFTIGFYSAADGTGPLPSTTLLGSQQTVSTAGLPTTPDWKEFTFSDVTMTDPTSGYNIVVKGVVSGGKLGYLSSTSAPQDSTVLKYSLNSGSTWSPSTTLEKTTDANFEVYGVFEGVAGESETETVQRFFVRGVTIGLRTGDDPNNRVRTAVDVLNAPEVATP